MPRRGSLLSRRECLKLGSLALGGLGANSIQPLTLRAREGAPLPSDRSVIFVYLPGGPPHLETYDLKPDAPSEIRGEFRPIHTVVPGLDVSEHLPLHARVADRFSLIRSISHTRSDHGGALKRVLSGREPATPEVNVNEFPWMGSIVAKMRESRQAGVPNYSALIDADREDYDGFTLGSSYLGQAMRPFSVAGDPSLGDFQVKNLAIDPRARAGLEGRVRLLRELDTTADTRDYGGSMAANDVFQRRALDLLTADVARRAFDLSYEPQSVRERYGLHPWGQRALLARRLVEAGASFVKVVMLSPITGRNWPTDTTNNWDSHAVGCNIFTDARWRLPYYDQAISALIEDLHTRGLDRRTMLIVTGEFGRTPRISYAQGRPGRDHWPQAMSVLVSGGGLRMGQVVGSTNDKGEHPHDRPLSPNDLWATMFHQLGIDPNHTSFLDHARRPMSILPDGKPIAELL
ncbi:MAG: DUF1501 domain-containing protein [Planctomycetia bacterium]|nr:DUF1501 domain-containing protein [Planctomycetia bacterium]